MNRPFILIGDPVDHSVSPTVYRTAFRLLGVGAAYEARRLPRRLAGRLVRLMRGVAVDGGGGNVTLPYKEAAARALDDATPAVERSGACNCFWLDVQGRLVGDNTDVEGFRSAVKEAPGVRLTGARLLLVGAGGGARAVITAAVDAGARSVDVWGRTPARVAAAIAPTVGSSTSVRAVDALATAEESYDLVINATPLGLAPGDPLPLALDAERARAAFDLVYGAEGTPWTRHAQEAGIPASDGLTMLVCQAAAAIRRWYPGLDVPESVVAAMRDAAHAELNRRP